MTKKIFFILLTGWLLTGCNLYPDDDIRTEDLDSVLTLFDRNSDLAGYVDYFLTDDFLPLTPDTNLIDIPDDIINPDPAVINFVLGKIEENMDALGYNRVMNAVNADLIINAGYVVITTDVTAIYNCYDPWYWYYDPYWGYPGYGWGYPSYGYYYGYPCSYSYSYDVGTGIFQMYDAKNIGNDAIPVLWTAIIRGLATSSTDLTRIEVGIDQAFDQTPIF